MEPPSWLRDLEKDEGLDRSQPSVFVHHQGPDATNTTMKMTKKRAESPEPWIRPSKSVMIEPMRPVPASHRPPAAAVQGPPGLAGASSRYRLLEEDDYHAEGGWDMPRRNVRLTRVKRVLVSIVLLPLSVLVCVLFAPLWLVLQLVAWTNWGRETRGFLHQNCVCMPNRVTLYSFGCEWCSNMHGVWWPWHECSGRGRCWEDESLWYSAADRELSYRIDVNETM